MTTTKRKAPGLNSEDNHILFQGMKSRELH